tara:strand:- start:1626 stop:1913 length:288 start_codon:yes stop_codon:yes gene_type:complete
MKLLKVTASENKNKRYSAHFKKDDGKIKVVSFGSPDHDNFIIHKNEKRKKAYLARHKNDLRTNDPTRAGYLSYYLLWNKKSLKESIKDYKQKFNL